MRAAESVSTRTDSKSRLPNDTAAQRRAGGSAATDPPVSCDVWVGGVQQSLETPLDTANQQPETNAEWPGSVRHVKESDCRLRGKCMESQVEGCLLYTSDAADE